MDKHSAYLFLLCSHSWSVGEFLPAARAQTCSDRHYLAHRTEYLLVYAEGDLAQTSSGEALEAAASLFSNDEAVAHPFLDNKKYQR